MKLQTEIQPLLRSFTAWALTDVNLVGAVLVGSHARGTARPDSDVDLVLLAVDPALYIQQPGWTSRFGCVARCQVEDYGPLTSLRVDYENGLEVEFGLAAPSWTAFPLDAGTRRVLADGASLLFEREPLLSRAIYAARPQLPPPVVD